MFEKLITDLKKSLPESLRGKGGDAKQVAPYSNEFDKEGNAGFNEIGPKIKKKTTNLAVSAAVASGAQEEDAAKKRNSMIVKVIIILGLTYFFVDEILLKETSNQVAQEKAISKKKKKPEAAAPIEGTPEAVAEVPVETSAETPVEALPEAPVEATAEVPAAATPAAEVPVETAPPVSIEASTATTAAATETPPIENINISENAPAVEEATPTQAPQEAPSAAPPEEIVSQTRIGESTVDSKIDQMVATVDQNNPIEEIKIPSQEPAVTEAPAEVKPAAETNNMASKITEEAVETAPPAYDQVGRGLVYNCKGKHWACLNKPAYLECNKNMQWNISKKNQPSCVVQEIYASDEDCAKIQKYNVTTLKPTTFCGN